MSNLGVPIHYLPLADLKIILSTQAFSSQWIIEESPFEGTNYALFLVNNHLFRLNLDKLGELAPAMKETVDAFQEASLGTEKKPFILGGTTVGTFNNFRLWMTSPHYEDPLTLTEQELVDLHHFAAEYQCIMAMEWVLQKLEALNLSASQKLARAIELGVTAWVQPAVVSLLATPSYDLTPDDWTILGYETLATISVAQLMLREARDRISVVPPLVYYGLGSITCPHYGGDHETSLCAKALDDIWCNLGREMIGPDAMSFAEGHAWLVNHNFDGVDTGCKMEVLRAIQLHFDVADRITETVVNKFKGTVAMTHHN